ncbi:MAG: TetR family transcriptional regulator C-terminal domain-containing protein [Candidatus Marinimicrobia bacterium]|nr:TetR family transcriptional regulator C-terminal domain-containing protein [Candidatus Neomarinimicrobiota bacterium]
MSNIEDKKRKIIEKGLSLMHLKGYNGTGLREIVEAAGIPKGSFYYYFDSKEHFAIAAMEFYYEKKHEEIKRILSDKKVSPIQRIVDLFSYWIEEDFSRVKFKKGCLLGNLALEMGDVNPDMGSIVDRDFRSYERLITKCLTEAKEAKELSPSSDVEKLAEFIWNSWEGAILRMKASKSSRPLKIFQEIVHKIILN